MGWHNRARPFNTEAAQLGEEAAQKEKESKSARDQVEQLLNHAMARAVYRTELDQERVQIEAQINQFLREIEETRVRISQLKSQETLLRAEEGVYCNQALELFSKAEEAMVQAIAHDEVADAIEQQICNMEINNPPIP